jgi:hypothetical protein
VISGSAGVVRFAGAGLRNGRQRAQHSRLHRDSNNAGCHVTPVSGRRSPGVKVRPVGLRPFQILTDEPGAGFPGCLEAQRLAVLLASIASKSLCYQIATPREPFPVFALPMLSHSANGAGERSGKQEADSGADDRGLQE